MGNPGRSICAAGVLFVGSLSWASIWASERGSADPVATRLINLLNTQVQERFKDTDKGLGITRMAPLDLGEIDESGRVRVRRHRVGTPSGRPSPARFRPENANEAAALRELKQAGLDVILYLGSRTGSVKGPVVVTAPPSLDGTSGADAVPDPSALRDPSRLALQAFAQGGSYAFASSRWKFIAAPVRASSQACVDCHQVPLGEVVGVALYGYQEARR